MRIEVMTYTYKCDNCSEEITNIYSYKINDETFDFCFGCSNKIKEIIGFLNAKLGLAIHIERYRRIGEVAND